MRMASAPSALVHERLVAFFADIASGIDADHMAYLIDRDKSVWQIIPGSLHRIAKTALFMRVPFIGVVTTDQLLAAAVEARPDCAAILRTQRGQRWLQENFGNGRAT